MGDSTTTAAAAADTSASSSSSTTTTTTHTVAAVAAWVAMVLAAVLVILATQNFRRTKGRQWKFHFIYVIVVAVLVLLVPNSVKTVIFSAAGVAVAGMIFPVYQSLRALVSPATVDDMEWLQYWCAQGGIYVSDDDVLDIIITFFWWCFFFLEPHTQNPCMYAFFAVPDRLLKRLPLG